MACNLLSLQFILPFGYILIRIHAPYTAGVHTDFGFCLPPEGSLYPEYNRSRLFNFKVKLPNE
jgi:hypothetical protein